MKFEIVTLFPDYFSLSLKQSLIGKAVEKEFFDIEIIQLRDFATDRHRTTDDTPFGGGGGMVLKPEPLDNCLQSLGYPYKSDQGKNQKEQIILMSASGKTFNQKKAIRFSLLNRLTIICGHYLGVDERILELYDIEEVSIGDYILNGGEAAAAVILDAVGRLIPGVLGNFESALGDSFMDQILGPPCYTRPSEYKGHKVPEKLISGNHKEIEIFKRHLALDKCIRNRPDLLKTADLTDEDNKYLNDIDNKSD